MGTPELHLPFGLHTPFERRPIGIHDAFAELGSQSEQQQVALSSLPEYEVTVRRRTPRNAPEDRGYGTIYHETVRYSDGAVRLVTIGEPKEPCSDIVIASADPWLTGPKGFNGIEIDQLVRAGFHVVWNHHQGRHATLPTSIDRTKTLAHFISSKSVGKSAAHEHALLDDLSHTAAFSTEEVIRKGYSRSAMSGEAFIALSQLRPEDKPRAVLWSDLEAVCFVRGVGVLALAKILSEQAIHESKALVDIAESVRKGVPIDDSNRTIELKDYAGTFDSNPLNVLHEMAWIHLLISGDAGLYARALPLNIKGIRTKYEHDKMGQNDDLQKLYDNRPGLTILDEKGAHLSGGSPEMLHKKDARYRKLAEYLRNGQPLAELSAADILPAVPSQRQRLQQIRAA